MVLNFPCHTFGQDRSLLVQWIAVEDRMGVRMNQKWCIFMKYIFIWLVVSSLPKKSKHMENHITNYQPVMQINLYKSIPSSWFQPIKKPKPNLMEVARGANHFFRLAREQHVYVQKSMYIHICIHLHIHMNFHMNLHSYIQQLMWLSNLCSYSSAHHQARGAGNQSPIVHDVKP